MSMKMETGYRWELHPRPLLLLLSKLPRVTEVHGEIRIEVVTLGVYESIMGYIADDLYRVMYGCKVWTNE